MSERPERAGLVVRLLVALTVVGLVFGGGVLVGWATRERRPPARSRGQEPVTAEEVKREIAACRSELKALAEARSTPPAPATPLPEGTEDAGRERAAKVEALRKEVKECRVRETLTNAHVCGTIDNQINLYFVLMHGASCVEKAGVEEFLVNSFDKCTEFDDFPAHLDEDKLTQEENIKVYGSKSNRAVQSKDNLVNYAKHIRRECRRIWALPDE